MRSFAAISLVLSQLSLPAARAQAPAVPIPSLTKDNRVVSGQLGVPGQPFSIRSAILSQTRRLNVALPASFASTGSARRYPVIIVFDGEYSFAPTVAAAQYLAAAGQIPEAVVVAVENLSDSFRDRVRDLTPPGLSVSGSSRNENGGKFLDFIERELLPAVAAQFRGGAPAILIGHSSGGVLATYAAATRPYTFPFVVAIDSPAHLQDGWLVKRLIESATKGPESFLRFASMESRFGFSENSWNELQAAAPASWKLFRQKLEHESHNSMPLLATYLGLREVFAGYSALAVPDSPTSAALEHYRTFNAASGLRLIPPRPLLERLIEDFLMEGNAARAREAFDFLKQGYGDTSRAADIRAQIAEAADLPPLEVTVEDLLKAPFPSPQELTAFLGVWNGTMQVAEDSPQPVRLRLEAKDGTVTGAWVNWPAPDVELVMPLQYIKLVPGGLHVGYMNGMRPRGMLVYEMKSEGGKLTGEMHMRGIRFTPPPGMPPPPKLIFRVTLERK